MPLAVILTMASRGFSIFGSGTLSTRTSPVPCQQRAFIGMTFSWLKVRRSDLQETGEKRPKAYRTLLSSAKTGIRPHESNSRFGDLQIPDRLREMVVITSANTSLCRAMPSTWLTAYCENLYIWAAKECYRGQSRRLAFLLLAVFHPWLTPSDTMSIGEGTGTGFVDDAGAKLPLDPAVHRLSGKPRRAIARSRPPIRGEQGADRRPVDRRLLGMRVRAVSAQPSRARPRNSRTGRAGADRKRSDRRRTARRAISRCCRSARRCCRPK